MVVPSVQAIVERLAAWLSKASSGHPAMRLRLSGSARRQLLALGEALKAPTVHALRGKEYVEWDNPYDVGMTGLIGFSSGYYAMLACDTLLMLGTDFPYRQFYPRQSQADRTDRHPGRDTSGDACRSTLV